MQKMDRHVSGQRGHIYRTIIASRLASSLHLLRSDPRAFGREGSKELEIRATFKCAGKRSTGGRPDKEVSKLLKFEMSSKSHSLDSEHRKHCNNKCICMYVAHGSWYYSIRYTYSVNI